MKNVVIIGAGTKWSFLAALTLIQNGIKPIIIEQGDCVDDRQIVVDKFRKHGILNFIKCPIWRRWLVLLLMEN